MATLNIKNLPDALYARLKARAKAQRRSVTQEVTSILANALDQPEPASLLALRGLGKELWQREGATAHVARERDAWD